ncbi:MAG TPA: dihydrolipoamide acetyltransferase family protein [Gemmatimonadaceae bacterium]|nr:dihydrolipoamide acetyltransferase family protein [Gemmatimonadaceae bacterium]
MARVDVVMPQMGESIAEGTVSRWLKRVGDQVRRDEPLFEITTDKVDVEIPSPADGVVAEILVGEGTTVPVQAVVARLETDVAAFGAGDGAGASAGTGAVQGTHASKPGVSRDVIPPAADSVIEVSPVAAGEERETSGAAEALEVRLRTKSSPLVRRMARERGVDLTKLRGSGIAGRVTKKDLLAFLEQEPTVPPSGVTVTAPWSEYEYQPPMVAPWPEDVVEPMSNIRRLTAGHMIYSKHTSAHVTTVFEVDLTRVSKVRDRLRPQYEASGDKLTYLPFIIQAVVAGLKQYPVVNAAVRGREIVFRRRYNIGIAVALDRGLIVPVIKGADNLSLAGITRTLNDLAQRARSKRLKPEEVQDATFTITNPGVFGSLWGTPVIPQPTVAILGTGAVEKRLKVITGPDGEDAVAVRTCAYFFLSFDHRIVDGADADGFMGFVKRQLENIPDQGF